MMNRGVFSHRTAFSTVPEKTIQTALNVLQQREDIPPEERVVVISDVLAQARVDAIQIRTWAVRVRAGGRVSWRRA